MRDGEGRMKRRTMQPRNMLFIDIFIQVRIFYRPINRLAILIFDFLKYYY